MCNFLHEWHLRHLNIHLERFGTRTCFFFLFPERVDLILVSLSHYEQLIVTIMYFCWNFLEFLKIKVDFTNTAKSS